MTKRKLLLANNPLLSGPALGERELVGIPYREVGINLIDRDPNQPRVHFDEERLQELSASIQTYGVLTPILLKPGRQPGRYNLISGERRLRAAHMAGLSTIPAMIEQSGKNTDERTLAIQLVENMQRADLTSLERAQAIGVLKDTYNLSIRDIADRLGVSKSMVERSLKIRELPDDLLSALREGASESKVLLLANIEDEEIRSSYLKDLDVLTRNQLEKDIDKNKSGEARTRSVSLNPEDQRISDEIQRSLGMKVKMSRSSESSESGRLTIDFYTNDDLQELFRKLVAEV